MIRPSLCAEFLVMEKQKESASDTKAAPVDNALSNLFELESLTNMDLFIQKCLCVQYPRRKTSERACGGSMGLLLVIKARFDLCLPLGSASALG